MRVRLERLLGEIWKGHRSVALHPLARLLYWLLIPFATMYASLLWGRREGYRLGFLRRRRVSAAVVVSIGNITVGGTGKTPLVVDLARGLMERGPPAPRPPGPGAAASAGIRRIRAPGWGRPCRR